MSFPSYNSDGLLALFLNQHWLYRHWNILTARSQSSVEPQRAHRAS
jgi:hypothetical protein